MTVTDEQHAAFEEQGFVVLPGYLDSADLAAANEAVAALYPTAEAFHSNPAGELAAPFLGDEFAGIRTFPFDSVVLNLLAVHPELIRLARRLLCSEDVRIYSAETWMKYTGAADYEQSLHRDFLNHTLLVPAPDAPQTQVEMFLFLHDVPETLGPPHFLSKTVSAGAGPEPNWIPRSRRPRWYEAEVSSAGPAGTVVAYGIDTFHRGTGLSEPRGSRATLHVSFRTAGTEWASRVAWADRSHLPAFGEFVQRASMEQLVLFGFPPPGHAYWTGQTLTDLAIRYPGLNVDRFRSVADRT